MTIQKLLVRTVGAAAVMAAMLAPAGAQAQSLTFQCPGCTTVGGGPSVTSNSLYNFMVGTTGAYDFYASGTNAGTITFNIFSNSDGTGLLKSFMFEEGSNPNTLVLDDFMLTGNQTYFLGASGDCTGNGQGCNTTIKIQEGTMAPPSTVPEPASMVLLATGLAGIGGVTLRRRAKR